MMEMMMILNHLFKILEKKGTKHKKKRANNRTDDDFQEPIKKMRVPEPIRVERRPFYAYHHEALSLRCSASAFLDTIRQFTEAQIADVKSMGFGPVLDIKVNYICTHLGYWLV
ncbi:hypothetical protein Hanom_Chr11g00975451 [Helianthus anomalus]